MLLDLTESDLINDFGITNRIHRERILSAIDAIKTSDEFSDEDDDEDDEEGDDQDGGEEEESGGIARDSEGDEGDEDRHDAAGTIAAAQRAARASLGEGSSEKVVGRQPCRRVPDVVFWVRSSVRASTRLAAEELAAVAPASWTRSIAAIFRLDGTSLPIVCSRCALLDCLVRLTRLCCSFAGSALLSRCSLHSGEPCNALRLLHRSRTHAHLRTR